MLFKIICENFTKFEQPFSAQTGGNFPTIK